VPRPTPARRPLSRERILTEAVELADQDGIAQLSMRRLGQRLGVEAMSLYNHVASRDDVLDGMVDTVFSEVVGATEVTLSPVGSTEVAADAKSSAAEHDWRSILRQRAQSMRAALRRHPWAVGVLESRRTPGPATLRHHDEVLGCLRRAGFSIAAAARAYTLLDSYVYGFALQEATLPFTPPDDVAALAGEMLAGETPDAYPYLAEYAREHLAQPGYDVGADFDDSFAVGLDLLLDGLGSRTQISDDQQRPRSR
jgi:AcrR family transcriptional regulator